MPIVLECHRCTACCRWPGEVGLAEAEISQLAAFKGMNERDFIEQFTRLRQDRRGLALKEQPNGACIFLDGKNCAVQPVKPQQCRDFPNRWMNVLWGQVPFELIQRDYPMLANCEAFQAFVKSPKQRDALAGIGQADSSHRA